MSHSNDLLNHAGADPAAAPRRLVERLGRFAPSDIPDDQALYQALLLLTFLLIGIAVLAILITVDLVLARPVHPAVLIIRLAMALVAVCGLVLLWFGRRWQAGLLTAAAAWGAVTAFNLAAGGLSATASEWYLITVMLAGFLVGRRPAIGFMLASLAAALGIDAAARAGLLRGDAALLAAAAQPSQHLLALTFGALIATAAAAALKRAYADLRARHRALALKHDDLKTINAELAHVAQIKDDIIARVSYELRTPVTSIKLYHHLLQVNPLKQAIYFERLKSETDRLQSTIEDLLALSQLDRDAALEDARALDLTPLVSNYVSGRVPLAEQNGLTLTFRAGTMLPSVQVDPRLFVQALGVLISNAIDYTPPGGRVEVVLDRQQRGGQMGVQVSVIDTGPGIRPEEQPRVFERYYRGEAAAAVGKPGSGLGLSIAREIIERYRGVIEVESTGEPGRGTRFTIWLPVSRQAPA
ncbi:MAG: hypothetical protein Kow00124_24360 [Anaerolineae bacterium]